MCVLKDRTDKVIRLFMQGAVERDRRMALFRELQDQMLTKIKIKKEENQDFIMQVLAVYLNKSGPHDLPHIRDL
jgi:tRNA uridine 5-carbamoylmethylation protein Kti12